MNASKTNIFTAPKTQYAAALRNRASALEVGGEPIKGQMDLFERNTTAPDPGRAAYSRENANIILNAPGETTQEVYELAYAGRDKTWGVARLVNNLGTAAGIVSGVALAAAGAPVSGLALGSLIKGLAFMTADCIAGTSQKYCDRMNAVGCSSNSEGVYYGSEGLIAEANKS